MIDFNFTINDMGEYLPILRRGLVNPKNCHDMKEIIKIIEHELFHEILQTEFDTTEKQDHFFLDKLGFIDDWID